LSSSVVNSNPTNTKLATNVAGPRVSLPILQGSSLDQSSFERKDDSAEMSRSN
jgi:hypothetical protein